jgi:hypothetical protein
MIFGEQVRSRELKSTAFGLVEINRNLIVTVKTIFCTFKVADQLIKALKF